jgi:CBS domain containing-hemolysin-like protein
LKIKKHKQADTESHLESFDSDQEAERILGALANVGHRKVKEVMIPRVDITALPIPVQLEDIKHAIRKSSHSRFPVYDEDLDKIVGVLFIKDIFKDERWWPDGDSRKLTLTSIDIARKLRAPYIVPESKELLELLAEMRQRRRDFAIVVDEYGGVSGVVTMKDLLGKLVGDLKDEYDTESSGEIVRVDKDSWIVDGVCPIDTFEANFDIHIPNGSYITIAGYILAILDDIPEANTEFNIAPYQFKILEMEKRRISKILITLNESSAEHT